MSVIKSIFDVVGRLRPSSLEFVTSGGADASGGEGPIIGVTAQTIQLKDNTSGNTQWFTFLGAGGGVGVGLPIGGSLSTPDFPSFGSKILKGPTNWGTLEFNDLIGGLGQIWVVSAAVGGGVSGSLVFFNNITPPPLPPVLFKAALWVEGVCLGIPGVGAMGYMGLWIKG